ncbi:hypothetical protein M2447_001555 [Ereboglobus sp. PH5-10]|nr:hypothetical protein [Ereboglobus sp. PH5-10]
MLVDFPLVVTRPEHHSHARGANMMNRLRIMLQNAGKQVGDFIVAARM